jgi:DnaJ-class molecular chaperone
MITEQYPIVCPSCNGSGVIPEPFGLSTNTTRGCPACNGSGVVIVTKVIES